MFVALSLALVLTTTRDPLDRPNIVLFFVDGIVEHSLAIDNMCILKGLNKPQILNLFQLYNKLVCLSFLCYATDLGYGDLGFTGHPSTRTPTLDRLAFTGKRLTSWYSAYPVCTASRTALMTGRQPPRVGMPGVLNSLSAAGLPLQEVTLAQELQAQGYKSVALGKWHLVIHLPGLLSVSVFPV